MKLIVTEKNTAAKKIADILGSGKVKAESYYRIPVYMFASDGGEFACIGLKGHILQLEYPPEYSDWRKVEPRELIDADLIKTPSAKSVVNALKKMAKQADRIIIATDYDREGELIGLEALGQALEANPGLESDVRRARYSALTAEEIRDAFGNMVDLSVPLAKAGEARQDIDLIWGATLTRYISLATSRLGNQFLSVGRVQSPTLKLIVERELERRAFVPEMYWQIFADLNSAAGPFTARHKTERFKEKEAAAAAYERASAAGSGSVTGVRTTRKKLPAPAPFNTTAYTKAATALGFSAARAIRLAEDLYLGGFISYPRTDNTVYPKSLDLKEILSALTGSKELKGHAAALLAQPELKPTRGKKETTDHPPIYPVGVPRAGDIDDAQWKIWMLVARRFLATLGNEAVSESNRIDLSIGEEPFMLSGSRIVEEGWLAYYPYSRSKDDEIPKLDEGQQVDVVRIFQEEKETQPPGRYGQGRLIELMEQNGLGTKATRHSILQTLYDRGYIRNTPAEPTETGISMVKALDTYANLITRPEMTAELEKEMSDIADEKVSKNDVVNRSRSLLHQAYEMMEKNKEALAGEIVKGIQEDKLIGECPNCGKQLRVIRSKKTKKRFVGCEGYPECSTTYPLPQRGNIMPTFKTCPECGSPKIKILTRGRRPWELCVDPDCPTKEEYKARLAKKRQAS
ncbi:MAG: DNA topoisomerase I [Actinobacteria bacterium]|nr:DNA topoisomerase I [Actinomycetota bacterium]